MNIKQHIEAGHYPKDKVGRSLVTMSNGVDVTIFATDFGDDQGLCIVGLVPGQKWARQWTANGERSHGVDQDMVLLPPAPRKVEVKAWGVFHGSTMQGAFGSEQLARNMARDWMANWKQKATVVELTGSYEEDWK
jgi:hypothetical protein